MLEPYWSVRIRPRHHPKPEPIHARDPDVDCSIFISSPTDSINTACGWFNLNPKGTCHTPNVIYILTYKFFDAFNVGETGFALNIRINNHDHFCTINKRDAPISLHTESHNTNFDLSFLVPIINI